jgi:flagellar protein FlaH
MSKILVVEDVADIRALLVETLVDAGHEVLEAGDGAEGLTSARRHRPDAILLDVMMPVMDGFDALRELAKDPATKDIPVVMLTAVSAEDGEKLGMDLGAAHYLNKPLEHGVLEAAIRVVLRGRSERAPESPAAREAQGGEGSGSTNLRAGEMDLDVGDARIFNATGKNATQRSGRRQAAAGQDKNAAVIRTADRLVALEQKMGGGLPLDTLTLVEGAASSGKSVLCQHLAFGAMSEGMEVVYFTSEHTRESLITQINSLGLDLTAHLRANRLKVFGVPEPQEGENPEPLLAALAQAMERLPASCRLVVVDAVSDLAGSSPESAVIAFFTSCRRISNKGRTVVISAHTHAFGAEMFTRLRALCDNYLLLKSETVGAKAVKTVEVRKLNSNNQENNNTLSFEVVPGMGMKVLPVARARV